MHQKPDKVLITHGPIVFSTKGFSCSWKLLWHMDEQYLPLKMFKVKISPQLSAIDITYSNAQVLPTSGTSEKQNSEQMGLCWLVWHNRYWSEHKAPLVKRSGCEPRHFITYQVCEFRWVISPCSSVPSMIKWGCDSPYNIKVPMILGED